MMCKMVSKIVMYCKANSKKKKLKTKLVKNLKNINFLNENLLKFKKSNIF